MTEWKRDKDKIIPINTRTNMKFFDSDNVRIAYRDEGFGDPILFIHGFASNVTANWANTGWIEALKRADYRVIAMDVRGHGQSEKLYDSERYTLPILMEDARRLLDHLVIQQADIMGYSMGARITAFLAFTHPERVRSVIFGGMGINMVRGLGGVGPIAAALEADSIDEVKNAVARSFRIFAEQTKSDLRALAACIRSARTKISAEALAAMRCPVLVAVGSEDVIAGNGQELAALIPRAAVFEIKKRDHMKAVGDPSYKRAVLSFLSQRL
jgi:pimeloyl-ACP methyl ester carboxylesterase